MNLQRYILLHIAAAIFLSLLLTAAYVLNRSHNAEQAQAQQTVAALAKQLLQQLQLRQAGIGQANRFPDFEPWKYRYAKPGQCIRYQPQDDGLPRSFCSGSPLSITLGPAWFNSAYRQLFGDTSPIKQSITFNGRIVGDLVFSSDGELEIAAAWQTAYDLMQLCAATLIGVGMLSYLGLYFALKPVKAIVATLQTMTAGQLQTRAPEFSLREWRQIAEALNQLAAGQQRLLDERQGLITRLLEIQEQERRELARELHDEYGQCLAAINAATASMRQNSASPALSADIERIAHINRHLQQHIAALLQRLRPVGWDEQGLSASLQTLIASWSRQMQGKAVFGLQIDGDCAALPPSLALNLFRIAQEALTNIAKHAAADTVDIRLSIGRRRVKLTIGDNGCALAVPDSADGLGLLGMRERAAEFNGRLMLNVIEPHGLQITAVLPLPDAGRTS
jgi:two-component system, NarL family, sensor histidine kinase UhpB